MTWSGPGPIPAGWLGCPNAGTLVADTFVAFKTPLRSEFQLSKNKRWSTNEVFNHCKDKLNLQLGLWIDLTNTERYFDKAEIEGQGIQYVKMKISGGGETPSSFYVQWFITKCLSFLDQNPGGIIGVHCTHGLNRTGFLICSFLAQVRKTSIDEAFSLFCNARPPGIYRQSYVQKLWDQYHSLQLAPVPAVKEPIWKDKEVKQRDNLNLKRSLDQTEAPTTHSPVLKRIRTSRDISCPQFFDDVPGIEYIYNKWLRDQVITDVRRMCGESLGTEFQRYHSYYDEYLCRRPQELVAENLNRLNSQHVVNSTFDTAAQYRLLVKAKDQVFFIDTVWNVFGVRNMNFPDRKDFKRKHITNTLLDGETIMSNHKGRLVPRFFVHDIIYFNGSPVTDNHSERLAMLKKEVLDPRMTCMKNGIILQRKESSMWLSPKVFHSIENTSQALQDSGNEGIPDGLKFFHKMELYKTNSSETFQWRKRNFVNFRIEADRWNDVAHLFVLELLEPFTWVRLNQDLKQHHGKIGQFEFDGRENYWKFVAEAPTHLPGSYANAVSVLSLKGTQVIAEESLLSAIQHNLISSVSRTSIPS